MASVKLTHTTYLHSDGEKLYSGQIGRVVAAGGARSTGTGYITILAESSSSHFGRDDVGKPSLHLSVDDARKLRTQLSRAIKSAEKAMKSHTCETEPRPTEQGKVNENPMDLDPVAFAEAVNATRPDAGYDGIRASEATCQALETVLSEADAAIKAIEAKLASKAASKAAPADPGIMLIDEAAIAARKAAPAPSVLVPAGHHPTDEIFYITK